MTELVSIIIPVFNCETYIVEAIESALAQTHHPIEIIVVNDGSTDGTMLALRSFGDRIKVIDQANGGVAKARNAGLAAAKGEYVAFLDADDVWLPGKVSAQVRSLDANPDVGACYVAWHVWSPDTDGSFHRPEFVFESVDSIRIDTKKSGFIYGRLIFDCEMLTTTVMIRSSIVRKIGEFNNNLKCGEDYDYWLRLSQITKINCLSCIYALYRVVVGSASRRAPSQNYELTVIKTAIERFGLTDSSGIKIDPKRIKKRMDTLVFRFGYIHLRQGDPSLAIAAFSESLRSRPLQPKIWLHVVEAFFRRLLRGNALTGA